MRIELSKTVAGPQGTQITNVTLREPRYGDLMTIGIPAVWVRLETGGGFEQVSDQSIQQWIERLSDVDPIWLEGLNLTDSMALRDAVMSFFREAATPKSTRSISSSDSSSSAAAGNPAPSRI